MALQLLYRYTNYVDANVALGMLQTEGITSFLIDEYSATIMPFINNGGIKLMVEEQDIAAAKMVLKDVAPTE